MRKFAIRKYNGDSIYSYAVFRAEDVRGFRGIVVYGNAEPIVTGLTRREAEYYQRKFNREFA
jgi:hypothetical protein